MSKGRSQYKTKISPGTEGVSFSPNGDIYALLSGLKVLNYSFIANLQPYHLPLHSVLTACICKDDIDKMKYFLGMQVTAHNVSEEGDIAATFDLEKRGLCMTFLSDEVGSIYG